MSERIVFDTTTVVSALLFTSGRLAWLREYWRTGDCVPLVSHATVLELTRVLNYPKFRLRVADQQELLADYLPYCEPVEASDLCLVQCRDAKDQPLLDLAQSGKADTLVSGDQDILVLAGLTNFLIETPSSFAHRVRQ